MARVVETTFIVKLSQLIKDRADIEPASLDELPSTIEQVVQELVPSDVLVEVEKMS